MPTIACNFDSHSWRILASRRMSRMYSLCIHSAAVSTEVPLRMSSTAAFTSALGLGRDRCMCVREGGNVPISHGVRHFDSSEVVLARLHHRGGARRFGVRLKGRRSRDNRPWDARRCIRMIRLKGHRLLLHDLKRRIRRVELQRGHAIFSSGRADVPAFERSTSPTSVLAHLSRLFHHDLQRFGCSPLVRWRLLPFGRACRILALVAVFAAGTASEGLHARAIAAYRTGRFGLHDHGRNEFEKMPLYFFGAMSFLVVSVSRVEKIEFERCFFRNEAYTPANAALCRRTGDAHNGR